VIAGQRTAPLRVLAGAAFLMATSAVGPGFLTQTAVFTQQLGASFGFAILLSVLFDLGAQLNIWRVLVVSGRRAQDVANIVVPGLGHAWSGGDPRGTHAAPIGPDATAHMLDFLLAPGAR